MSSSVLTCLVRHRVLALNPWIQLWRTTASLLMSQYESMRTSMTHERSRLYSSRPRTRLSQGAEQRRTLLELLSIPLSSEQLTSC